MMQIDVLIEKIKKTGAPIVVGLDPMLSYVPSFLIDEANAEMGEGLDATLEAIYRYNVGIMDAVCDLVPAVKPQVAMYEQFGPKGMQLYADTIAYAKEKGLVVIGDVKRGDIGSTSAAYATAHIGEITVAGTGYRAFDADFATVNPYLGTDGVKPFTDVAAKDGTGIFVLVKTSNPSSGELQDLVVDGHPIYEHVAGLVNKWGENLMGESGYSSVGAVVGATYPEMGAVLRKLMPKTMILVPGYGAQGGKGKDLVNFFNEDGLGAIVNSSRGIIAAYKQEAYASYGEKGYADAARAAVIAMKEDIASALA